MRKFFIFLSLFLLLGACSIYKKVPVYQKSFSFDQREEAIKEAYWWMDAYKADSIPMEDWFIYQNYLDDGYSIEKVFQKRWDEKTEIVISLTSCMCDSTTYHLLVLKRSKDKKVR